MYQKRPDQISSTVNFFPTIVTMVQGGGGAAWGCYWLQCKARNTYLQFRTTADIHMQALVGVVAPRVHGIRTVATIRGQTAVNHPKMHPPKPPMQPQKTLDANTHPVFRGPVV